MSYSRRQLYALGEPLGDSVTRKEGGRIVYGDGGGSPAPSSSQTQISELPDWAKGYAKDTLAKAGALTDISQNPYKPYEANRIAGFSPLQQQAQQQAAGMQTSGATGFGTQLAGAAGLGALGARYDPTQFQADQFGGDAAQRYMSPYMQNVVDIQQREAQRQGDIAGTQLAGQATKSGAFGGGRQAIMQAEAARNLAQQKGDIQARGLQSSYEQAQNQFNADQARRMQAQQLAEQSKQYGAGYGMQGLQTALQGAGQLGTLGGQEFAQGMDINKLQSAYGGQQQALQQQGLTQAYQDFQNQQNYPYKQLGFMSDMIRGLPLGQQSTSQIYEAPGSTAGQLAGLGTGLYGLSKFMAEGGSVNSYADGGSVDSQQNVANIVSQLSNEQLKQALQAAQARADMDQIEAIQREMAERASMSKGLASIPMNYEAMMPDEAVGMANGGIVAFAGGDVVEDYGAALDAARAKEEAVRKGLSGLGVRFKQQQPEAYQGTLTAMEQAKQERKLAEDRYAQYMSTQPESKAFGIGAGAPTVSMARQQARENPKPEVAAPTKAKAEQPVLTAKAEEKKAAPAPDIKAEVKKAASPAAISKSVDKIAEETGVPKQTLMEQFDEIQKKFSSNNEATNAILKKAEEKLAGRAEEIKGKGLGEALMAFGFSMAAEAAKPGGKLLKAAAAASPTLGKTAMDNQKLQMAAEDNLSKMQIDRAKYDQAMQKQDTATATTLLAQIRQGEYQDATLKEQIAQNARENALKREQMGITAGYYAKGPELLQIANDLQRNDPTLSRKEALEQASGFKNAGSLARTDQANLAAYNAAMAKLRDKLNMALQMPANSEMRKNAERELAAGKAELQRLHGLSGDGAASPPPQVIKVDNQGNPIK